MTIDAAQHVSQAANQSPNLCHVLSLDGGGAKGFYTLGVLKEVEAILSVPLHEKFDIVFGTSTGAIIACLIGLGYKVDEIHELYKAYVPRVMSKKKPAAKSAALATLAAQVFQKRTFSDVKTGVGVVATRWVTERPMIFKGNVNQAHGLKGTFVPGFGVSIAEEVQVMRSRIRLTQDA